MSAHSLALLSEPERQAVLSSLTDEEAIALAEDWTFWAREKQLAPLGDWTIWLILAGRGFGKTRSIVQWGSAQAKAVPKSRGALVARTAADVRDVLVEGESGFLNQSPSSFMPKYEPSKRRLTFPNGSIATTFSADEPAMLRGPQFDWAICDELATWQFEEAWDNLLFGLRLGENPRVAVATTPKPIPLLKRLLEDPTCAVVSGSTYENIANLAPTYINRIVKRYEGTRLGQQELYAKLLGDTPGALWNRALIERMRVTRVPSLKRVVIAIDPAVSVSSESAETGIIAVGIGTDNHGYVLEDATLIAAPEQRAKAALALYHKYEADCIVAEVNNGGDWIPAAIHAVEANAPVRVVRASRGKRTRAEPVAMLYEQGKVHHVGMLGTLEDQLCSWTPDDADSPDRLDALVWGITELMIDGAGELAIGEAPKALADFFGGLTN